MLLTITTTHTPATDLGYLLLKHPDRAQSVELGFGTAHIFYPESTAERTTCALYVEVDPVGLVRGRGEGEGPLAAYVNDRPYVASSFLSVAISNVFGTALSGIAREREVLVKEAIPLEVVVAQVRITKAGEKTLAHRLFEPLGYVVEVEQKPHGITGELRLRGTLLLRDLLRHLTVLLPVLDDDKHYWVDDAEVEKLLRRGEGWLATHPEKELISFRYLKRMRGLTRRALARLDEEEGQAPDEANEQGDREEHEVEKPLRLQGQRMEAVLEALRAHNVKTVADLGCGEGKLVKLLLDERRFARVIGMDVSPRTLERAEKRLDVISMPVTKKARLSLFQGSLLYRDKRLEGLDAAVLVEVIEHLDLDRLPFLEESVFRSIRPRVVIITTPNVEHNARFVGLAKGAMRHRDHRFEWTREEFRTWGTRVALRHSYTVTWQGIGEDDPLLGPPTQMLIFEQSQALFVPEQAHAAAHEALFQHGEGI